MKSAIATVSMIWSLAAFASGQDETYKNPFAPEAAAPSAPVVTSAPNMLDNFEFNGIMKVGASVQASVLDRASGKSYWLALGQQGEDGVALVNYSSDDDSIIIQLGGYSKRMELKEISIVTQKAPRPSPDAGVSSIPAQVMLNQPGQPNIQAASDDEVRERMQRVAEEIRRRRALRSTVVEQGGNN